MSENRATFVIDVATAEGRRALTEMAEAFRETGEKAEDAEEGAEEAGSAFQRMARMMQADQLRAMVEGLRQVAGAAMDVARTTNANTAEVARAVRDTRRWAEAVGATVEEMEALGRVGLLAGGQFDNVADVGDLIQELGDRAKEASEGNEAYASTFAQLGVSVTDSAGNMRDQADIFVEVNDKLATMTNQADAMAIAGDLMTDIGRGWVASLRDQGVTLTELMARMQAHGTLTDDQRERLRRYERVTAELEVAEQRLAQTLATATAPALAAYSERLNQSLQTLIDTNPSLATLVGLAKDASPALADAAQGAFIMAAGLQAMGVSLTAVSLPLTVLVGGMLTAGPISISFADQVNRLAERFEDGSFKGNVLAFVVRRIGDSINMLITPAGFAARKLAELFNLQPPPWMAQWMGLSGAPAGGGGGGGGGLGFLDVINNDITARGRLAQQQIAARTPPPRYRGVPTVPPVMQAGGGGLAPLQPVDPTKALRDERDLRAAEVDKLEALHRQLVANGSETDSVAAATEELAKARERLATAERNLAAAEGPLAQARLAASQERERADEAERAQQERVADLEQRRRLLEREAELLEQMGEHQMAFDARREAILMAREIAAATPGRGDDELAGFEASINLNALEAQERQRVQRLEEEARRQREEYLRTQADQARAGVETANLTGSVDAQARAFERLQETLRNLQTFYASIGKEQDAVRVSNELLQAQLERTEKLSLGQEVLSSGNPGAVQDLLARSGRLGGFERIPLAYGQSAVGVGDVLSTVGSSPVGVGDALQAGRRIGAGLAGEYRGMLETAIAAALRTLIQQMRPGGPG